MPVAVEEWRKRIGRFVPHDRPRRKRWWEKSQVASVKANHSLKDSPELKADPGEMKEWSFCQSLIDLQRMSRPTLLICLFIIAGLLLRLSDDVEPNPGPGTSKINPGLSDKTLFDIAQYIYKENDITKLGLELGLGLPDINRFIQTNHLGAEVTSKGTVNMLLKWREGISRKDQCNILTDALKNVGLVTVSERLSASSSSSTASPSSSSSTLSAATEIAERTQPKSLHSGEIIDQCKADIISYFRTHLCRIKTDPLNYNSYVDFEKLYTNLSLIEENGDRKEPLAYNDLLSLTINGKLVTRIMIQGEAGAGKTTLCAKIAWDWASGAGFQNFHLVVVAQLRYANKCSTVGQIIEKYLRDDNPATAAQIDSFCHANPDKVLLLFDGLDEFAGDLSSEGEDEIIGRIIRSSKFSCGTVIVTTRPWKADEIRGNLEIRQAFRFVEVQGFKREDVATYVRKFFSFSDKEVPLAKNLVQFVNENDVISSHMAPFPIFVSMLCVMWKELPSEKLDGIRKLQTFFQIFKEMVSFLVDHFLMKGIKNRKDIKKSAIESVKITQIQIGALALRGLLKKKLVFSSDDFKDFKGAKETGCRLGIISQEEETFPDRCREDGTEAFRSSITFPHKLFQEFMAGKYLASLYKTDRDAFVRYIQQSMLPRAEEFRYLFYFVTGQEERLGGDVVKWLCEKSENEMDKLDFIADVVFEGHSETAASFFERFLLLIEKGERLSVRYLTPHTLSGYLFSLKHLVELSIFRNNYAFNGSRVLANAICSIKTLEKLVVQRSVLHSEFYQRVGENAKSSQMRSLKMEEQDLNDDIASENAAKWISSMPYLTSLTIKSTTFHPGFFRRAATTDSISKICNLRLHDLDLSEHSDSSGEVAEWISSLPHLTRLEMNGVKFHSNFYMQSSQRAERSMINTLKIVGIQLGNDTDSHHAAKWICGLNHLTTLKLAKSEFDESFFTRSPMSSGKVLQKVNSLRLNGIDLPEEHTSRSLATLILSMPCLTQLTIDWSKFHEAFFSDLAMNGGSLKIHKLKLKKMLPIYRKKSQMAQYAAEWISSMDNLRKVSFYLPSFHEAFTASLAANAIHSKISVVKLVRETNVPVQKFSGKSAISRDAAKWIRSLPELQHLMLAGEFPGELISAISRDTASSKIVRLELSNCHCSGDEESAPPSDEARLINSLPCLSHLKMDGEFDDEFYSSVRCDAFSSNITLLEISRGVGDVVKCPDMAMWISSLQSLSHLRLEGVFHDDIYTELSHSASSSKVVKLRLFQEYNSHKTVDSTQCQAGGWICSLPCLTELTLHLNGTFQANLFSELARHADSLKIRILQLSLTGQAMESSTDALEFIVSLPCLTDLSLNSKLSNEFYSRLAATQSKSRIETLQLFRNSLRHNETASHNLGMWIASMSSLSNLCLRDQLHDKFYHLVSKHSVSKSLAELTINAEHFSRLCSSGGLTDFCQGISKLCIEFDHYVETELFYLVCLPKLRTLILGSCRRSTPALESPARLCSLMFEYMPRLSFVSFVNLKIGNTNAAAILRELDDDDGDHEYLQSVKFVNCNTTESLDTSHPTEESGWELHVEHGCAVQE